MSKMPKNDEHINLSAFNVLKHEIWIPNRNFGCLDFGFAGCNLHLQNVEFRRATTETHPKGPSGHKQGHSIPPRLKLYQKSTKKTSVSTIFAPGTLLESFTTKESNNFKLLLLSCNVKRCCYIICGASAFCWHPTPTKNGQLQGAHYQLLWREVFFRSLWCLGLLLAPDSDKKRTTSGCSFSAAT